MRQTTVLCLLALTASACGSEHQITIVTTTTVEKSAPTSTTLAPAPTSQAETITTMPEAPTTTAPTPWPPAGYSVSRDGKTAWVESAPGYTCTTGELPCVQIDIVSRDSCLTFGLTGRVVEADGFEGSYLVGDAGTMSGPYRKVTPPGQHVLGQLGRDAGSAQARARVDDITCS